MLKMAYNSSRNAKKILGRGGANPLNCHTKWGGDQKKKCDKCHTFFLFSTLTGSLILILKYFRMSRTLTDFHLGNSNSNMQTLDKRISASTDQLDSIRGEREKDFLILKYFRSQIKDFLAPFSVSRFLL